MNKQCLNKPNCFAENGNFATPSTVGRYYFLIFDKRCAFSSTVLYFVANLVEKIYKYTTNGNYLRTFVTGFEFGCLAAAESNLYAVVSRSNNSDSL